MYSIAIYEAKIYPSIMRNDNINIQYTLYVVQYTKKKQRLIAKTEETNKRTTAETTTTKATTEAAKKKRWKRKNGKNEAKYEPST